jgi:hypothetical protein
LPKGWLHLPDACRIKYEKGFKFPPFSKEGAKGEFSPPMLESWMVNPQGKN